MRKVTLVEYSSKQHLPFLKKWLTNEILMKGWGMPPFWEDKVEGWAGEPDKVILMIKDETLDKIVGFVNFYDWDKEKRVASRGTLVDPKHQNKGYGKMAIVESNKYAFDQMKLERIELYIEDDNEASRHITEKLGYTYDRYDPAKKRHYYFVTSE